MKVCYGERSIHLAEACGNGAEAAAPCLDESHAFVMDELSMKLKKVAIDIAFVPNSTGKILRRQRDMMDPGMKVSRSFKHVLADSLPVSWIAENQKYINLLRELGVQSSPSARALKACAVHLHSLSGELSPTKRKMSQDLVVSLAHALSELAHCLDPRAASAVP